MTPDFDPAALSILIPRWGDKHRQEAPLTQSRTGPAQGRQDEGLLKAGGHLTEVLRHLEYSETTGRRGRRSVRAEKVRTLGT